MENTKNAVFGIRAIAAFEAFKGLIVLVAGLGLLTLIHKNLQDVAEEIVQSLHLNPESHYPQIFIAAMSRINDTNLKIFAALAVVYALFRFIEAYGLWRLRTWAEYLAIISGSIYIPFELYELAKKPTFIRLFIVLANIAIVAYLVRYRLIQHRKNKVIVSGE